MSFEFLFPQNKKPLLVGVVLKFAEKTLPRGRHSELAFVFFEELPLILACLARHLAKHPHLLPLSTHAEKTRKTSRFLAPLLFVLLGSAP